MPWSDLRLVLDEEIDRLPEKYRRAIVLCYLEGKTNQEAAQHLGCPAGTVASRLARGRERLRTRLTRRGLTLSAVAVGAVLSQKAAPAAPAPALVKSTAQAALAKLTATWRSVIEDNVVTPSEQTDRKRGQRGMFE